MQKNRQYTMNRPFVWAPILLAVTLGLLLLLLMPSVALAAPLAQEEAPGESNLGFLFAAFAVAWAVFFGYVFYMSRRERELRRDLDQLRRQVAEQQPDSSF